MTCRPWCTSHLIDAGGTVDVCVGPDVHLDFGDQGGHCVSCSDVVVDLTQARDNAEPSLMVHIDAEPVADLNRNQAAAIAWALLAQIAQADGDPTLADYYRSRADEHSAAATVRSTR